ncbi:MAG: hypothetical protein HY964_00295 [Ignavibacteriales bacterium]|nr:hypothetical protein [Ignavibacteriales bacterium]
MKINKVKILVKSLILIILFSYPLFNQHISGIYWRHELIRKEINKLKPQVSNIKNDNEKYGGKCGLGIMFDLNDNWDKLSQRQKKILSNALSPLALQSDTIIGRFHIYFDTTGLNAPALLDLNSNRIEGTWRQFIDSVGYYFNHSWSYFVNELGYEAPPLQAGNSYYNIYIEELYSLYNPLYGETVFFESDRIGNYNPPRYSSYIRIDNDFKDLRSEGIAGLSVTAAHELHHAFQLGSYGYRNGDIYFYEITSTWMEEVLFPDVNDYYQYIRTVTNNPKGQFLYPEISFTSPWWGVSYSRGIWGKYIQKKFSSAVMRNTWNYFRQEQAINAMDDALLEVGSSFRNAFLEWTIWNNNTGPGSDSSKYYDDVKDFPQMTTLPNVEYISEARSFSDSVEVIASVYVPVCIMKSISENCNTSPQMKVIVTNLNTIASSGSKYEFQYKLSPSSFVGSKSLSNGINVGLIVNDPGNWSTQENVPTIISDIIVFPNPYIPDKSKPLIFRLPNASKETATLSIFTSSMDRVINKEVNVVSPTFEPIISWDGHDDNGNIVTSGIYFYVVTIDKKDYVGKIAVIKK